MMQPVQPILVGQRFGELHGRLMTLLAGVKTEEWRLRAAGSRWTVKDLAAHLLDTDLRRLSHQRDRHPLPAPEQPIAGPGELVAYLDRLNTEWVRAAARLSPEVLIELLAVAGPKLAALFATLDPFAPAIFPVAWAGDEVSPNWFDVAREFTEKWIHQQQIREATGRRDLDDKELLFPVLDTFVRGVPYALRGAGAGDGAVVTLRIEGPAGGGWSARSDDGSWKLYQGLPQSAADAAVTMSQGTAWRFFSSRRRKAELLPSIVCQGDRRLCDGVLGTTSVMA